MMTATSAVSGRMVLVVLTVPWMIRATLIHIFLHETVNAFGFAAITSPKTKTTTTTTTIRLLKENEPPSSNIIASRATTRSVVPSLFVSSSLLSSASTTEKPTTNAKIESSEEGILPESETNTTSRLNNNEFDSDRYSSAFENLVRAVTTCLLESDKRRENSAEHSSLISSSTTNWMNDKTSTIVKQLMDDIDIQPPNHRRGINRDDASSFLRWMKSTPTSTIIDLSNDFRMIASDCLMLLDVSNDLQSSSPIVENNQLGDQFVNRMICRLIVLPSGTSLQKPLWEPPASIVYGKLLYGGVTRYRRLVSTNRASSSSSSSSSSLTQRIRKAGERTEIKQSSASISSSSSSSSKSNNEVPTWIQYGGTERMYESLDIGPACLLEIALLPPPVGQQQDRHGTTTDSRNTHENNKQATNSGNNGDSSSLPHRMSQTDMIIQNFAWDPIDIFELRHRVDDTGGIGTSDFFTPTSQSGKDRNDAFNNEFRQAVGGLQPQIDAIVRRVLDGRVLRPVVTTEEDTEMDQDDNMLGSFEEEEDETIRSLAQATLESRELDLLGLTPVRGLLLYGPPGTGKTLLARQIAKALRARTPKIVSAPELLDRWVGGSEKLVRQLFADAEAELASVNGDATKSALHVIVIDEIDAVFRKRSAGEDSGEQTRASVVNQILVKLDGVHSIDNILMIGMTNRRELLDEALLRPGRLEVQIEVPLPDLEGRREILQIHFDALRRNGRLSRSLCCAIDGVPYVPTAFSPADDSNNERNTDTGVVHDDNIERKTRKRDKLKRGIKQLFRAVRPYPDLASATEGFSGADIAGLVRSAGSLALARAREDGSGIDGLLITLQDALDAIQEIK